MRQAFTEYKETDGKQLESAIKSDMHDLKEKKGQAKILTESCTKSRKEMERIKERLDDKRMARKADVRGVKAATKLTGRGGDRRRGVQLLQGAERPEDMLSRGHG